MSSERREGRIGRALDEYRALAVPDDLDLWPAIRARAAGQRARRRMILSAGAVAAVLVLAIILLVARGPLGQRRDLPGLMAVIVCDKPTALECAYQADGGTKYILSAKLGREVDVAHAVAGWTVTVRRVYADANRVVIGYTVDGPAPNRYGGLTTPPTLVDPAAPATGGGSGYEWAGGFPAYKDGQHAQVVWFEHSGAPLPAGDLLLRFTISRLGLAAPAQPAAQQATFVPGGAPIATDTPGPLATATAAPPAPLDAGGQADGPGPFTFDLSIPFDTLVRAVDVGQTVAAATATPPEAAVPSTPTTGPAGRDNQQFEVTPTTVPAAATDTPAPGAVSSMGQGRATLERVVVSPTEARFYLSGVRLAGDGCMASMRAGSWDSTRNTGWCNCRLLADGRTACSFGASLLEERGEWELTLAGSWAFRFSLP